MSTDFHIPLFHKLYAGNVYDSVECRTVTEKLATLLDFVCQHAMLGACSVRESS